MHPACIPSLPLLLSLLLTRGQGLGAVWGDRAVAAAVYVTQRWCWPVSRPVTADSVCTELYGCGFEFERTAEAEKAACPALVWVGILFHSSPSNFFLKCN